MSPFNLQEMICLGKKLVNCPLEFAIFNVTIEDVHGIKPQVTSDKLLNSPSHLPYTSL